MRDIKMRVWNTEWKMMIPPENITNILTDAAGMYGVEFYITVTQTDNEETQEKDMWEEDCVFMQYTGLKDKNGKEIYEGDILEVKNNFGQVIDKREVVFKELSDDVEGYVINIGIGFNVNKLSAVESKVIGNIHENPELLEVKE